MYRHLEKIGDEKIWQHIPRHYGFINTDLGRGGVFQLVRNDDGTIALPLIEEIRRGNVVSDAALEEFFCFLRLGYLRSGWFDRCNINNIVCAHSIGGKASLFIVDGLSLPPKLSLLSQPRRWAQLDQFFPGNKEKMRLRTERDKREILDQIKKHLNEATKLG